VLFRYRELLLKHFDDLAALISREHGKTRGEARGDLQRGLEVVEFATGVSAIISPVDGLNTGVVASCVGRSH